MPYSYRTIINALKDAKIESAPHEARILINRFCGTDMAQIPASPDKVYDTPELDAAVKRRITHYPLQYIVGEVGFFHGTFKVTEDTLIPRRDTEAVVEYVVENLPKNGFFADLCTGSGCIGVSVLMERKDARCLATDISVGALKVARENAKANGVGERFFPLHADVLRPELVKAYAPFDMIVSNPPYIPTADIAALEKEVKFEPLSALDGGKDGLDFYHALISGYMQYLVRGGCAVFEIGYDQNKSLEKIARDAGARCQIKKDIGGNFRVAVITP